MERIFKYWQAQILKGGGSRDFRRALRVESLMWPFVAEFLEKIIEFRLLLHAIQALGASGFRFEREVQALMSAVLLWMTGLDAFHRDAQTQPPDKEFGEVEPRVG